MKLKNNKTLHLYYKIMTYDYHFAYKFITEYILRNCTQFKCNIQ